VKVGGDAQATRVSERSAGVGRCMGRVRVEGRTLGRGEERVGRCGRGRWAELRGLGRTLGRDNGPLGKKTDRAWVGCWLDLVLG
jgi:hypothetical protein